MHSPNLAARLIREMDEVHAFWEECHNRRLEITRHEDEKELSLIYAALLMSVPEGLERLRKAWILDRLEAEETAVVSPCQQASYSGQVRQD